MEHGDEHRTLAERELLPAQLGDAVLGLEEQLGGEVAERHDAPRLDERDLRVEVRPTRLDLEWEWVTVARRAALHHVGDVHLGAREADALDQAGEEAAGAADERLPRQVLLLARALAHEEDVGMRIAHAEDDLRARRRQRALRARERL